MNETVREIIGWVLYSAIIILLLIMLAKFPQRTLDCNDCGRACFGIVTVGGEVKDLPEANITLNWTEESVWEKYSTKS